MASITLCPRCSSHLELPTGVAPTSLVECPICEAEFLLASVAPRAIPKARLVEHRADADDVVLPSSSATLGSSATVLGVIVDESEFPSAAPEATELNTLSHLLRSSASWQLSGVQPAPEAGEGDDAVNENPLHEDSLDIEIDDRIIPNDHAPRVPSLDAAYRDADPKLALPVPARAPVPARLDEQDLGGSRLDEILSGFLKFSGPAAPVDAESHAADKNPASAKFLPFDPTSNASEATDETDPPSRAQLSAEHLEQEGLEESHASDDSFDDRWRHAQGSNAEAGVDEHDVDEEQEWAEQQSEEESATQEFDDFQVAASPRRRRQSSLLRTLVGAVSGGIIGIFGGAYLLLWVLGPSGDLLGLTKWVPQALLPSAGTTTANVADRLPPPAPVGDPASAELPPPGIDSSASKLTLEDDGNQPGEQLAATGDHAPTASEPEQTPMHQDDKVAPAAAEEPIIAADPFAKPHSIGAAATAPANPSKQWPTTPIVGSLQGVKLYRIADIEALLPGADVAHRKFLDGDLARKEDVAGMGQAFIELCKLAEQFTLTDPAEFGNDLITKQLIAKQIFRGVVGDPARRNDLAMIAGRWVEHNRRPNQGVVLLGRVTDLNARGPWTEYTIESQLGGATSISKVLMDRVYFSAGDEAAIVGVIVPDPRTAISGYDGDAKQVIVSGYAFPPADFVAPKMSATADIFSQ